MTEKMNIYQKMNLIKTELLNTKLGKSGHNTHAKFEYFQLEDIIPAVTQLCNKYGVYLQTRFSSEFATMTVFDIEDTDKSVTFTSPMKEIAIPGSNAIQALGGVETYQRRYLLLMAFDIVAPDLFDSTAGTMGNKELMITAEQRKWLEENTNVAKLLELLQITDLAQLTATKAQTLIDKKVKQMEDK